DRGRYFTVSGQHLAATPASVEYRHNELQALFARYAPSLRTNAPTPASRPGFVPMDNDDDLIAKATAAKNGPKFTKLWDGDYSEYPSQSEGDLALCRMLAYRTGRAPEQVDRMFRRLGLMRAKWDEVHVDGETYGAATVALACKLTLDDDAHDDIPLT